MIKIEHLTKDYGQRRGVFDISLDIKPGEVYGYLGPNGAGKSTTLRHVMGFGKPDGGLVTVNGLDAWRDRSKIKEFTGYLPGEISLPEDMNGLDYLKLITAMRKMNSFDYAKTLMKYFDIDPDTGIKRMSKGMKQKVAIVAAFMHDPEVIFLDEPTSGLDPLMQEHFLNLVAEKKAQGKTILMSSHIFDEVSKVCDRVGILKNGELVNEVSMEAFRHSNHKSFAVTLANDADCEKLGILYPDAIRKGREMTLTVENGELNTLIRALAQCELAGFEERKHSLEEYFMKYYGGDGNV